MSIRVEDLTEMEREALRLLDHLIIPYSKDCVPTEGASGGALLTLRRMRSLENFGLVRLTERGVRLTVNGRRLANRLDF